MEECTVQHAGNRVQLVVEEGQRAALAGDVDQVRLPAVQEEATGAGDFQHVAHAGRLLDVPAIGPGIRVPGA